MKPKRKWRRPKWQRPLDTPAEASSIRVTNLQTGETRTDPALTKKQRRNLNEFNKKHLSTKQRHPWKTPPE